MIGPHHDKKKKKDRDNYSDKKRGKILYSAVWLNPLTSYEEKSQQNYQMLQTFLRFSLETPFVIKTYPKLLCSPSDSYFYFYQSIITSKAPCKTLYNPFIKRQRWAREKHFLITFPYIT